MSLKIMVVDAEPKSAPLLRAVATPLGHSVLTFRDYEAAGQKGETQPFDVAFLGMRPPDLSAIDLAHRIRNSPPNRKAAIVMVTATDDIVVLRKAFGQGADLVVMEPVQGGRLHRMLSAMERPGWKDKKPAARLPLFTEVTCSRFHRQHFLNSLNISETGIALRGEVGASIGEEISLVFRIAEVHASLNVRARIIRKDESAKTVGLEFIHLSREDQNSIQVYVMGHLKEAPARELANFGSLRLRT